VRALSASAAAVKSLRRRYADVALGDRSNVYNTDLIQLLELGAMLDVAEAIVVSALERGESRGSHQRLDFAGRDDENYLKHSLAYYSTTGDPEIRYRDVTITKSQPAERVYGGA